MFKNNVLKKLSIVVASLALVLPLASVNNGSASANAKPRKRITRIIKAHHHAKPIKKAKRAHHYYKFAYNKKEYYRYLKDVSVYKNGIRKINERFQTSKKSVAYRKGFNDALSNNYHKTLVNNKQYKRGYLVANAYSIDGKVTKKTIKSGENWYNDLKKNGPATTPAVDQMKNEAHINVL